MVRHYIPEIALGSLLTIAVFAIGLVVGSQHFSQTPQVYPQQKTAERIQQEQNSQTAPPHQKQEHARAAESRAANHTPDITVLGIRIGEGLLAIATFLLFLATWCLVRDAKRNAQRQLRAYMGMADDGTKYLGKTGDVKIMLKNYGQTPANRVSMWIRIIEGASDHSDFDYVEGTWIGRNQITHPGQHFGQIVWNAGTLADPDKKFFLYGYATYTDAFEKRWRYCFAYAHDLRRGGDAWRCYHEHNYEEPEDARPGAAPPEATAKPASNKAKIIEAE